VYVLIPNLATQVVVAAVAAGMAAGQYATQNPRVIFLCLLFMFL